MDKITDDGSYDYFQKIIFLDNEDDEGYIHAQLIKLVEKSEESGAAVGIGHVKPKTLKILKKHIPELQKKGY